MPGESYCRRLRSCYYACVTFFERLLTPLCVDSARALWVSFCFRFVTMHSEADMQMCVFVCLYVESVSR